MRFLLRAAFWLGIVLVLLPSVGSERPSTTAPTPEVSAAQAAAAASAMVSDMGQFCARQPEACAVGGHIAAALGHRAQTGAKMLYEFLQEKLAAPDGKPPAAPVGGVSPTSLPAQKASQNTLIPADHAPHWRGEQPRKEGPASGLFERRAFFLSPPEL